MDLINITSVCISAIAMVISFFTFRESKIMRKEQGESFLFVELMQIDSILYVVIHNIGSTYASNVDISISKPFVNRFSNLKVIPPSTSYRFSLLDAQNINAYPPELSVTVSYTDRYKKNKEMQKKFVFKIIDYMQYDISYNTMLSVYEINKTY